MRRKRGRYAIEVDDDTYVGEVRSDREITYLVDQVLCKLITNHFQFTSIFDWLYRCYVLNADCLNQEFFGNCYI